MKRPRPSVVEKIQAQPRVETADVQNLLVGARAGLRFMGGQDLVNVSLSIARVEAAFAPPAPAKPAEPATPPAQG